MDWLAAIMHTFDPFAVEISRGVGLRWYGLAYLAGFAVGYFMVRAVTRQGRSPMEPKDAGDFVVLMALAVMVGGRLGYCLFYQPDLLVEFTSDVPFWGALAMHKGGMSFHGGLLGVIGACGLYAWRKKLPFLHLADFCAVGATVGIFFGRVANFINGELYGRKAGEGVAWAVKFPQEIRDWKPVEQFVQLRDVVPTVGVSGEQWKSWFGQTEPQARQEAERNIRATLEQLIDAVQRGQTETIEAMRPVLMARHPSQLYEAIAEGLVVFVVLALIWAKPRKTGVIGCWFLVLYGLGRILCENYRLPDAHIAHLEAATLGITRGQVLSAAMVLVGIPLMIWVSRRSGDRLGGWLAGSVVDTETGKGSENK